MRRAARRWPWVGVAWWKTSHTCPVKVGDVDTDMRLICHEGLTEAFLLTWGEPVARGAQKIADLGRGGRLCVRGDRSCLAGRGDGVDGVGQALLAWRREHEGGSDARVAQASPSGVPVKIEQSGVGEHAHDRVGVRGLGEFVDNGRVGVGHVQCRKARTGHEARVGDADGGSREVVVAVVVVVDDSPVKCVVSCARVIVGAVGAFRGESPFEGFAHRFGQERPGDGIGRRDRVRVKCGDAWRRPVARGEGRSCSSVRLPGVGVFALVGSGCAVRSRRLAQVRASGLVASLRNEAVAGVVIVCPSTQQPCGYSTSVKCYGGATCRRWRRFPGQRRPRRRSAAMRVVATKSLVIWLRVCWPEGCFFGHWRSGTTFSLATGAATRRAVRKHRAPKGALRRTRPHLNGSPANVRKHRAPKGALRLARLGN